MPFSCMPFSLFALSAHNSLSLQLVYADIDVKTPAVSSRSRPPLPPTQGLVTQEDNIGPVMYATVQPK